MTKEQFFISELKNSGITSLNFPELVPELDGQINMYIMSYNVITCHAVSGGIEFNVVATKMMQVNEEVKYGSMTIGLNDILDKARIAMTTKDSQYLITLINKINNSSEMEFDYSPEQKYLN